MGAGGHRVPTGLSDGAIAALKASGKLASIKVGGFDGSPDAVAAIKAGRPQHTVLQPVAVFSAKAADEAATFLKTGAAHEKQLFNCLLITKANTSHVISGFTYKR